MALRPSRRKPSVALDGQPHLGAAHVVEREALVEQADERADRGAALLSLALPSSSAERPSTSRRLTSLPSVAPTIAPLEVDDQHDLGLGIVPGRDRMNADLGAVADRRHRRRLGEDLGVRADADLEILRPQCPSAMSSCLQRHRLRRAGLQLGEVVADQRRRSRRGSPSACSGAPRACSSITRSSMRDGEGDAGGLDRLQVDRREQPGLVAGRAVARRVGEDVGEIADALALAGARRRRRIGGLAQVAHGRQRARDVEDAVGADRHHGRTARVPAATPARPARPPCRRAAAWQPVSCSLRWTTSSLPVSALPKRQSARLLWSLAGPACNDLALAGYTSRSADEVPVGVAGGRPLAATLGQDCVMQARGLTPANKEET